MILDGEIGTGFSVYVERKKSNENLSMNNFVNNDNFKSQLNEIYPKYIERWVDESVVLNCQDQHCNIKFSAWYNRKHHCRACGCVYCGNCCKQYITIPSYVKKPIESATYLQQLNNLKHGSQEQLVCNVCFAKLKNLESISENISIAEYFDLDTLFSLLKASKKWYNACIHYLSKFREIQYHKTYTLYTNWEINILRLSKNILFEHSNWKLHIIKSSLQNYYETMDNNNINDIIAILKAYKADTKKRCLCLKLMCSRKCFLALDIVDYIEILNFVSFLDNRKNIFWENVILKTFLLEILQHICKESNVLHCQIFKNTIPLLCSILASLTNDLMEYVDKDFIEKIFDQLLVYPGVIYYLYDEIEYLRGEHKNMGIINLYDIIKNYINTYKKNLPNEEKISEMKSTLIALINDKKADIKLPMIYPLNYDLKVVKIINNRVMESNSRPILLEMKIEDKTKEQKYAKFLIKKEATLRKEQIVSCIISLLLFKLEQHETLQHKNTDKLPSYYIKMLNKDVGVIEFVEDSITLREINVKGFTLQNYILNNNKNEALDAIKKRFAISMATSCCITYLLGLGDRHLDNIMVNKRGQIFNIDYGYILDNPITNFLGAPSIKVTLDMIDFLGGQNSEYYKLFEDYLLYVYDIMRLYKNIIVDHYELLGNEKMIDWNKYRDKLESRFMTGLIGRDIKIVLSNEIQSSNSYSSIFNDICHNLGMGLKKS
ncbi:phosphatidylinositol kinase [Bodo saltans virus]|uniref:Phosphatidylinositol kinase n=1 Tax=Bodo saltans virus TaxID=2024608 RepID=A0A2H4UVD3_9VIRU|nr:phosphatidylinositol kinase [Bodo saltans virus]ATZ80816.1 phosphatidylinositol kinase [Bodo saltans virus]